MNASGTIFLTVSALFYTIFTTVLFLKKKKINKIENKIFTKILFLSILSMIMELLIVYTKDINVIGTVVQKLFLVCIILWLYKFVEYTFTITVFNKKVSDKDNLNKYKFLHYIFTGLNLLISVLIMILPITFNSTGNAKYTSGPAVNMVFGTTGCYMILMSLLMIIFAKNVKKNNYLPAISLILLLTLTAILQNINPALLLTNGVFGLVIFLMYNTIENPDLKLIAELELARDHAEKANYAKSDFLSSMSHEIRTPLNGIVGCISILQDEKDLSEDGKEALNDLKNVSNGLLEIGSGILNISQIESGKIEIQEKDYSPSEMFNELTSLLKLRIQNKDVEFITDYSNKLPDMLYGDKSKIKEIITNLLTNAIKYTDHGQIILSVKCENKADECKLTVSVKDTGRGIKKEMIDKLFQKFSRAEEVKDSNIEGTGLGLAITKNLVEIMGGKINVESEYGKGSNFTVILIQKIVQKNIEEKNNEVTSTLQNKSSRILIIDDNSMNLKIEEKHLKSYGLITDTCLSGEEALNKINNGEKYSLILTDDMMPAMSGTDLMKKLKYDLNYKSPIIVITGNATTEAKEEYLSNGFDDYIAKPVSREQLYEIIKKYL